VSAAGHTPQPDPLGGSAFVDRERDDTPETAGAPVRPLRPIVLLFGRLGDTIMLTAMLRRLHRRYHLPSYLIAAGSWNAAVCQGNPDVAGVWSFGRHFPFPLHAAWREVRRALRASDPGPVYVCEKHYRQLPRVRRMLRLSGIDRARCLFITDETGDAAEPQFDKMLRLGSRTPPALCARDYPTPAEAEGPHLYVSDAERAQRDAWLKAHGGLGRDLILVQPGSHRTMSRRRDRWRRTGADTKAWPLERWAQLLRRIHVHSPEALLVLRGSREELPMLQQIEAAAALDCVVIAGDTLRELFALCEAAHSMVSVDTGPAHAAAALSLPEVVLYVAEDWLRWLPRSPTGSAVLPVVGSGRIDHIPVDAVFEAWCALARHNEHGIGKAS
jgi:heptosyltransferase-2/heptosyltransferase-3